MQAIYGKQQQDIHMHMLPLLHHLVVKARSRTLGPQAQSLLTFVLAGRDN